MRNSVKHSSGTPILFPYKSDLSFFLESDLRVVQRKKREKKKAFSHFSLFLLLTTHLQQHNTSSSWTRPQKERKKNSEKMFSIFRFNRSISTISKVRGPLSRSFLLAQNSKQASFLPKKTHPSYPLGLLHGTLSSFSFSIQELTPRRKARRLPPQG